MNNKQPGSIPRKTMINDQPHMLAYINPREAMMLKSMGGAGKPGPGGVPAFYYGGDFGEGGRGAGDSGPGETGGPGQGPGGGDGFRGGDQSPNDSGYVSQSGGGESPAARAAQLQAIKDQNAINAANAANVQKQQTSAIETFQAKVDDNKPKTILDYMPVSLIGNKLTNLQNQAAIDQLSGKKDFNPGLFGPGGRFSGKDSKSFSHFSPVTDSSGNLVGSQAIATDGTTIGYRGQRTGSLSGSQGDVQSYVDAMNAAGQGGPPEGGQEAIFQSTDPVTGTPIDPVNTIDPQNYLIKNLQIQQPDTSTQYEVPSIYMDGGVVSLDPFKQLRNKM